MPEKRLCRCGKVFDIDRRYCPTCTTKAEKQKAYNAKVYDSTKRNRGAADIYHGKQWPIVSGQCKDRYKGICAYSWYTYNELEYGHLSHHIIEVDEGRDRIYDLENLIYLSNGVHNKIHAIYESSEQARKEMQALLFHYVNKWKREMG